MDIIWRDVCTCYLRASEHEVGYQAPSYLVVVKLYTTYCGAVLFKLN